MAEFRFGKAGGGDWSSVTDFRTGDVIGLVRRAESPRGSWDWAVGDRRGNCPTRGESATVLRAIHWEKPKRGRPPLDPGGAMVRLEIRLPKALRAWAEAEAHARKQTVSELVRSLLEDERAAR